MLIKLTLDQGAKPATRCQELTIARSTTEEPRTQIEKRRGRSREGLRDLRSRHGFGQVERRSLAGSPTKGKVSWWLLGFSNLARFHPDI